MITNSVIRITNMLLGVFLLGLLMASTAAAQTGEIIQPGNIMQVRNDGSRHFSSDGGLTWTEVATIKGERIMMRDGSGYRHFSEDGGITWTRVPEVPLRNILIRKDNGEELRSTDGGNTWQQVRPEIDVTSPSLPLLGGVMWERRLKLDSVSSAVPGGLMILQNGDLLINGGAVGQGFLLRTRPEGEHIWSRRYGSPDSLIYILLGTERQDGSIDFIGSKALSIVVPSGYYYHIRTDQAGEILSYGYAEADLMPNPIGFITPLAGGGFIEGGTITLGSPDLHGNAFIRRTDAARAELWNHTYDKGNDRFSSPVSIVPTSGGGFVFAAARRSSTGATTSSVTHIDGAGGFVWERLLDSTYGTPIAILENQRGGYFLVSNVWSASFQPQRIGVTSIGTDGEVQGATKTFGIGDITTASAAINSGNEVIIAGFKGSFNGNGTQSVDSTRDFYLLKIDADGNRVWEESWGTENVTDVLRRIALKGDGTMVLAGYSGLNAQQGAEQIYLAGFQDLPSSVDVMDAVQGMIELAVQPNPAATSATVSYMLPAAGNARLVLVDQLGNEVRRMEHGYTVSTLQTTSLDLEDIPAGIYYLRLSSGSRMRVLPVVVAR